MLKWPKEPVPVIPEIPIPKAKLVWIGSLNDPFGFGEEYYLHTINIAIRVQEKGYIPILLTKNSDLKIPAWLKRAGYDGFLGYTITDIVKRPEEPYAPPNEERIEALKVASELGLKTFVSIEPWLPGAKIFPLIEKLSEFTKRIIIGSLNHVKNKPIKEYIKKWPALHYKLEQLRNFGVLTFVKKELLPYCPWQNPSLTEFWST